MLVLRSISEAKDFVSSAGRTPINLVPTMGNLHYGHKSLISEAKFDYGLTVVTIFVNPLQFNNQTDFEQYPYTPEMDIKLCEDFYVDAIFMPTAEEMYNNGHNSVMVMAGSAANGFEGTHRPGHFNGVATVVAKLFNIFKPRRAYFGLKDLQQCAVIVQMVEELNYNIDIKLIYTVRLSTGLALSSRNNRLSDEMLVKANNLYKAIKYVSQQFKNDRPSVLIEEAKTKWLSDFEVEYIDAVRLDTKNHVFVPGDYQRFVERYLILPAFINTPPNFEGLIPYSEQNTPQKGQWWAIVVAAHLASVRLIDNIIFKIE